MGKRVVFVAVVVALGGAVAPSHGAVLPAVGKITGGALYSCFPNDKPVDTRPFRIEYEGRIQHAGHTYTVTHGVGVGGDTCSLGRSLQEGSVLMNLTSETASGTFIAYCAGRLADAAYPGPEDVASKLGTYTRLDLTCSDSPPYVGGPPVGQPASFQLAAIVRFKGGQQNPSAAYLKGYYESVGTGDPLGTGLYPRPLPI